MHQLIMRILPRARILLGMSCAVGLAACNAPNDSSRSTATSPSAPAVTQLEPVQQQPVTKLQTETAASTSLTTTQQGQTTTISVQQAMTDLGATQSAEGIVVILPENILFDFDKYNLRPSAAPALAKLAVLLKNYAEAPVAINGYTDSIGGDDYNQTLSENRAKSVKTYLAQQLQISADRLQTKGYGKADPVASNTNPDGSDNPSGRQKNRRVEVIIRN
jgi:outer membrane protein OmpA-like peptidoglycan-associated protein